MKGWRKVRLEDSNLMKYFLGIDSLSVGLENAQAKPKTQLTIIPNEAPITKEFIAPSMKNRVKITIDHIENMQLKLSKNPQL